MGPALAKGFFPVPLGDPLLTGAAGLATLAADFGVALEGGGLGSVATGVSGGGAGTFAGTEQAEGTDHSNDGAEETEQRCERDDGIEQGNAAVEALELDARSVQ